MKANPIEVSGKYNTFQKNGLCSILKFEDEIPKSKKKNIPTTGKSHARK